MNLVEVKLCNTSFNPIFSWNWMKWTTSYWSRNDADEFSYSSIFCSYYPKIDLSLHFDAFYPKISRFYQKIESFISFFYYKSMYAYKFHASTMKTDFRNMSENRKFRWKKWSKIGSKQQNLHNFFFSKKQCL